MPLFSMPKPFAGLRPPRLPGSDFLICAFQVVPELPTIRSGVTFDSGLTSILSASKFFFTLGILYFTYCMLFLTLHE